VTCRHRRLCRLPVNLGIGPEDGESTSGGPYSVMLALPRGSLEFSGETPATYVDTGTSGLPVYRRFCGKCGSPLVTDAEAAPNMHFLKTGSLDDASWVRRRPRSGATRRCPGRRCRKAWRRCGRTRRSADRLGQRFANASEERSREIATDDGDSNVPRAAPSWRRSIWP
jgi:hypothetical protein